MTRIKVYNVLMTVGFDSAQFLLSIILALVYHSHRKDSKKKRGEDYHNQLILHPDLEQH